MPRLWFGVPVGTSMTTPPVASSFQTFAKASTSARCVGVSDPRLWPMKTSTVRDPSRIPIW